MYRLSRLCMTQQLTLPHCRTQRLNMLCFKALATLSLELFLSFSKRKSSLCDRCGMNRHSSIIRLTRSNWWSPSRFSSSNLASQSDPWRRTISLQCRASTTNLSGSLASVLSRPKTIMRRSTTEIVSLWFVSWSHSSHSLCSTHLTSISASWTPSAPTWQIAAARTWRTCSSPWSTILSATIVQAMVSRILARLTRQETGRHLWPYAFTSSWSWLSISHLQSKTSAISLMAGILRWRRFMSTS